MANQPNILFIISDQHNAKVMGHQGHPDVKTPHLDRLASQGVRFDAAITQNPICTPSRVSFLSGQYCHNHGYYGLSGPNPRGLPNLLGHFRRAGYRTGAIGKIHCPAYWVEDECDVFHETCGCSIEGRSPAYADYLAERGLTDLEDHEAMNEFGRRGRQTCDARPSKVTYRDGQEGWIATQAIAFMRQADQDGVPFIIQASLPKPHQCYTPAQEFWDLYDEANLTLPPNTDYDLAGKAPNLRQTAALMRSGDWTLFEPRTFEAGRLRKLHGYLGSVSHVDHAVGELVAFLDEAGIADNTIVIYTADHGDYACEHDIMEKAPGIGSDAITRIPMIWRWPGQIAAGRACRQIVESVDLAPTLCALANLPPLETADGADLSGLLHGGDDPIHAIGVTECPWSKSVRKGQWRYVHYVPDRFPDDYPEGFGELYNLAADPWEMNNLCFDPQHAPIVAELKQDLLNWLITTTRPTTFLPAITWASPQAHTHYHHTVNADNKLSPRNIREYVKKTKSLPVNYI